VAWDGNADNAGFKERDIIKRIGGKEVKDAGELKKIYDDAVANVEKTFQLSVEVVRKGRKMQLVLNFRLDPEKEETL
jgi:C-terminal processing protease CtpA/Prc